MFDGVLLLVALLLGVLGAISSFQVIRHVRTMRSIQRTMRSIQRTLDETDRILTGEDFYGPRPW